jgi:protein-disulfide isomerase
MPQRLARILDGLAAIAMIAASATMIWFVAARRPPPAADALAARPKAPPVESIDTAETLDPAPASTRGRTGARLALVEFTDLQCPFCGRYARDVFPQLQKEFIDTGTVQYILHNFPLEMGHPQAFAAAEAAECAGRQGHYWEMHDRLFADQKALARDALEASARALGLNESVFKKCMDGEAAKTIRDDEELGHRLGVRSTPTFFIGEVGPDRKIRLTKKITGAQPYSVFRDTLQSFLVSRMAAR